MDEFSNFLTSFKSSLTRARGLCDIHDYLSKNHTSALDMTDMLRASVVLSVSAFDYLVHEIFRVEAIRRLKAKRPVSRFTVPFNILNRDNADFEMHLDAHIREINSYKSFVDPKKFSEALGCFVADPWTKIATQIGSRPDELKTRIRAIYRWRNRIAHEADINPVLSGIGLWPIHKSDVVGAIEDIELVGVASVKLLRES